MKIKVRSVHYDEVMDKTFPKRKKPLKPNIFWRTLIKILSASALLPIGFSARRIGMEKLGKKEPCLVLMNHSCFNDFEIASTLLFPRPLNIVTTFDGMVGKAWLMRQIGCFPTQKYVSDLGLVRDMSYTIKKLKSSILMYPEACYSLDGTATVLPDSLGHCIKMLGVPVVMIKTYGAFLRNPLYNNLQTRKVRIRADVEYLLSPEEIGAKSADEINATVREAFTFDAFKWQKDNGIKIDEPFRADDLDRVLYKCPHCMAEGQNEGKGIHLTCMACGKVYELDEYGSMRALDGNTEFCHVPDWYAWQRQCVREEIERGEYSLDIPVDIYILADTKCLYSVGEGRLVHTDDGFRLTGCEGKLDFTQKTRSSYSLNTDYYWYEMGDVICIGNTKVSYYCFPKGKKTPVAKVRLATEELFKLKS